VVEPSRPEPVAGGPLDREPFVCSVAVKQREIYGLEPAQPPQPITTCMPVSEQPPPGASA